MSGHRRWIRRAAAPRQAVQPGSRGVEALDQLLGEVRELRMTFVTDLSTAAGAVEAGATDIAADILDADRAELDRFFRVADERLRELERAAHRELPADADVVALPTASRSRTRRRVAVALPAVPLVGALTMAAAAAAGILPLPGTSTSTSHHGTSVAATESNALAQFETVVNSDPSAQQVIAAADKLHQQIVAMMATSKGDPAQANAIAQLLQAERDLLLRAQPPGAQAVLAATSTLITQLKGHTTATVTTALATPKPADVTTTTSPKPSPSPSPSKTTKSSPTPTHSSSPSSSPTSTSGPSGPLPKVGG